MEIIPCAPFELVFGGAGAFPPSGPQRVLGLGVTRGVDEARVLQRVVSDRLEGAGVQLEARPFSPHLAFGRWRDRGPRVRRTDLSTAASVARVPVDGVTLYESRLSPAGPEHRPLALARLEPPLGQPR